MKKEYREFAVSTKKAKYNSYGPFSKFGFGTPLLTSDDQIFNGYNIENISYLLTIHAECIAIVKAISRGASKFKAITVVSDNYGFTLPCGAFQQILYNLTGNIDFITTEAKK